MAHLARIIVALNAAGLTLLGTVTIGRADSLADIKPRIFAPGVISGPAHDSAPTFTPDGSIVVFGVICDEVA